MLDLGFCALETNLVSQVASWPTSQNAVKTHFPGQHTRPGRIFILYMIYIYIINNDTSGDSETCLHLVWYERNSRDPRCKDWRRTFFSHRCAICWNGNLNRELWFAKKYNWRWTKPCIFECLDRFPSLRTKRSWVPLANLQGSRSPNLSHWNPVDRCVYIYIYRGLYDLIYWCLLVCWTHN